MIFMNTCIESCYFAKEVRVCVCVCVCRPFYGSQVCRGTKMHLEIDTWGNKTNQFVLHCHGSNARCASKNMRYSDH